jgi:tetratricopeptide (TPR) repeat protein
LREALGRSRLSAEDSVGATQIARDLSQLLREQGKVSELASLYLQIFPRHLKTWPGDVEPEVRWLTDGLLVEGKSAQLETLFQRLIPDDLNKEPRAAELLRARAGSRARQRRFPDAAKDFSRAIAMGAGTVHDWFCWATLLAELEQREAYRGVCQRAIEFVRNTSEPAAAEQIAKSCLLLKDPGIDLSAIQRLSDFAASATNNVNITWFEVTKALAEYREGRFASALEWLRRALARPGESPDREALAETIRALAWQASGQSAASKAALERSFRIFPPETLASGSDLGRDWVSRVFVNVLQREAVSMAEMK